MATSQLQRARLNILQYRVKQNQPPFQRNSVTDAIALTAIAWQTKCFCARCWKLDMAARFCANRPKHVPYIFRFSKPLRLKNKSILRKLRDQIKRSNMYFIFLGFHSWYDCYQGPPKHKQHIYTYYQVLLGLLNWYVITSGENVWSMLSMKNWRRRRRHRNNTVRYGHRMWWSLDAGGVLERGGKCSNSYDVASFCRGRR